MKRFTSLFLIILSLSLVFSFSMADYSWAKAGGQSNNGGKSSMGKGGDRGQDSKGSIGKGGDRDKGKGDRSSSVGRGDGKRGGKSDRGSVGRGDGKRGGKNDRGIGRGDSKRGGKSDRGYGKNDRNGKRGGKKDGRYGDSKRGDKRGKHGDKRGGKRDGHKGHRGHKGHGDCNHGDDTAVDSPAEAPADVASVEDNDGNWPLRFDGEKSEFSGITAKSLFPDDDGWMDPNQTIGGVSNKIQQAK